jgi:hypothetical protein
MNVIAFPARLMLLRAVKVHSAGDQKASCAPWLVTDTDVKCCFACCAVKPQLVTCCMILGCNSGLLIVE